ncbi:hypothetical protein DZG03_09870, partial [Clavibacter phaseoli]
ALVVGLLAGAGVAVGLGGSAAPSADSTSTATATPSATATDEAAPAPDPADVRSLLGTDISRTSAPLAVDGILAAPQQEADTPPRSPGGDIDLTSIRGVQTSVGLYVARTISGDACVLVYPWTGSSPAEGNSPGSGVASCAPPSSPSRASRSPGSRTCRRERSTAACGWPAAGSASSGPPTGR